MYFFTKKVQIRVYFNFDGTCSLQKSIRNVSSKTIPINTSDNIEYTAKLSMDKMHSFL